VHPKTRIALFFSTIWKIRAKNSNGAGFKKIPLQILTKSLNKKPGLPGLY